MISGMVSSPRIASMSSMQSFPNSRSMMHATRYIITTLFCSRSTVASWEKICIASPSTTSFDVFVIGALFDWTRRRN